MRDVYLKDAVNMSSLAPGSLQELTERLQADFAEMPPQFQIGARYLLNNPSEVPVSSMRKIAQQAGVQPATLVRLAQSLGSSLDGVKGYFCALFACRWACLCFSGPPGDASSQSARSGGQGR